MKRILDGKIYDTETATLRADISGNDGALPSNEFEWQHTGLYVSPRGTYFIAGRGGARSRWAKPMGLGTGPGEGLIIISDAEARNLFEKFGDMDKYAEYFGEPKIG
jgi:hypothetical protein